MIGLDGLPVVQTCGPGEAAGWETIFDGERNAEEGLLFKQSLFLLLGHFLEFFIQLFGFCQSFIKSCVNNTVENWIDILNSFNEHLHKVLYRYGTILYFS